MRLLLPRLGWFVEMIYLTRRGRDPRMRKREVGVELNCLIVKIDRRLKILQQVIRPRLILAPTQIEHVRVGISCGFGFDARFFLRRESRLQRIGDTLRHFGFHAEDVGQLPVKTLRP